MGLGRLSWISTHRKSDWPSNSTATAIFEKEAREYDQERTRFIERFGIRIVRILNSNVYENLDGILEMIGNEVLKRRGESV